MKTKNTSTPTVQTRYSFYKASETETEAFDQLTSSKPSEEGQAGRLSSDLDEKKDVHKSLKIETNLDGERSDENHSNESKIDNNKGLNVVQNDELHPTDFDLDETPIEETSPHEKAIRDALLFIRKRSTARSKILNIQNGNSGEDSLMKQTFAEFSSKEIGNATELDTRLLSPPADVRMSATDMFRSNDKDGNQGTKQRAADIERAEPIFSHSASGSSWNVVPSSPAPGKLNLLSSQSTNKNNLVENIGRNSDLDQNVLNEIEIEKGIEKVLLAVLQSGKSSGSVEDILSSMFASTSISEPLESSTNKEAKHYATPKNSDLRHSKSLLDDIINEDYDQSSDQFSTVSSLKQSLEKESQESDENSNESDKELYTCIEPDSLGIEAIESPRRKESNVDELYDEDDIDDIDERVLGRLSKKMGGTTGIVLDGDNDGGDEEHSFENQNSPLCAASIPSYNEDMKETTPSSITSSILSTVRKTSSSLLFGSSDNFENEHPLISQAKNSIILDLYEHILVRHPSSRQQKKIKGAESSENFSEWLSNKFKSSSSPNNESLRWDKEDPDEPGYILHTLSRENLIAIEATFSEMISSLEDEYYAVNKRTKSVFQRDLEQAEKILDKETKQTEAPDTRSHSKKIEQEDAQDPLVINPNFPGAKAAGHGHVGDLEIYHLPIIYKAHQTGFEATKDLVLSPDTVFAGQYYVQSELGSAAFSTAYRCVDLNSGKKGGDGEVYYDEVCLKVIKNTKDFFDQSLDEIKILELLRQTGQCDENNILEMKTFFYHKEHLIIVTELLRQNLFEFGKYIMDHDEPQYFTRNRLCYIARQCLVALSFVHKLGLVHSDIKPENILLASYSRARVKIIDFGSSCYATDRQSSYIQSRSYRAPEVVLGLPYDGKIDIWSLGCVIAEMYTGQVTFQNDSVVSMLSRIEAICGAFPRHMIENGRQSDLFFTPTGLLYEKNEVDEETHPDSSRSFAEDDHDESFFNVFQPKTTTMAERLGFDPDLMSRSRHTWEEDEKALFVDFVTKLLTIDPDKRPTADEALEHPWILSGFNLSEDDLRYPPE